MFKKDDLSFDTMMYQIMSSINWSETTKGNVKAKIKELNEQFAGEKGVSMFGSSLAKQWKAYDSDDRYSTASLRFNSTDIETSIRNTEVVFEPTETGKEYTIDQMGDGLRSLFYISLVDSILDVECQMQKEIEEDIENTSFSRKPPILTIIALEEPENHIAPHLLGKLVGNLSNIAGKSNAQAIMTSHSPAIVKRVDPEKLRYFRIDNDLLASRVRSITLPEKESVQDQYKYVKEAVRAYPELYFAKLVIFGEGDSEEIILPKYWETINGSVDVSGISIVPLGGRHVNHFWRLLNDLQIPHITLLDLDREREGGGWGRIRYVLKQLLSNDHDRNELLHMHLRDKGYEFDRNEGGKYPKIKPKNGQKWTRIHQLGEDYSLASIDKTIEANYWKGLCSYASYVGKVKNNNIRNLRHPPRQHWLYAPVRDYGPLLTLVLTFVYLLGGPDLIAPNDPAPKYQPITPEMREATRKCEMYSRQAVLMGQEDINTKEDADAFLERTERELMALERKRKDLYNRIRRCNDPEVKLQVQEEIHALTAEMKPLRRQISDIKNVLERSGVMREMVEAEEKMRREKLEREYFLNPKEKAELKNTQPKSSEPQAQPRKRDDDRGR